jgi:hypothetical protein
MLTLYNQALPSLVVGQSSTLSNPQLLAPCLENAKNIPSQLDSTITAPQGELPPPCSAYD